MHACWILLCMSLNMLSYASLIYKEGISMRKKSEGGLAGSVPLACGWLGMLHLQNRIMRSIVQSKGDFPI
jgi:hypothetical protein